MKETLFESASAACFPAMKGSDPTPVIADGGDAAWVVVLDCAWQAGLGTRFTFMGQCWEICQPRTMLRGFVAAPVELCN